MADQKQVFLTYASDTKPLAETLTQALRRQGIAVWADFLLLPGQKWKAEVEQALDRSGMFVILVGPNSQASQWQEWEWRAALEKVWTDSGKTLIPVVVGSDQPPPFLREWVSLRVDPATESEVWTKKVLDVLRTRRSTAPRGLRSGDKLLRDRRLKEIASEAEKLAASHPQPRPPKANVTK